ncbi:hypothetical protein I7I48_04688 [Histoplasma ohiense]|nr:hypothetical protein I7I48_04688 [Histoplasma ohiense (nom. inval.)]
MATIARPFTEAASYLNPSVDPAELGFLAIGLGGSRAHSSHNILSDWDGIGILRNKEEICQLITARRDDLCELLWIEVEECLSWSGVKAGFEQSNWEVLRYSGRAKDRTKRSIRFLTVECLLAVYSDPHLCRLGVLSRRPVRSFRCYYQNLGPVLYVYQPERVSEELYILEDADFLIPETATHGLHHPNPGVTCELLLTSVPLFDTARSILDIFKSLIIRKWLKLAGTKGPEDMIGFFYSSGTFSSEYRQKLEKDIVRLSALKADHEVKGISQNSIRLGPLARTSISDDLAIKIDYDGYRMTCFLGTPKSRIGEYYSDTCQTDQQPITTSEFILDTQTREYVQSPFSSNSTSFYARAMFKKTRSWVNIFAKHGPGVTAEIAALSSLRHYFPSGMLQKVLAFDPVSNTVFYEKHQGEVLSDIRVTISKGIVGVPFKCAQDAFDWLVSVELVRAEQVAAVQLNTIRSEATKKEQLIHRFYYDRLHLDGRALEFYGITVPEFFQTEMRRLSFKEFMSLPLIINGRELDSLYHYCRQAEAILNPRGLHLINSSVAVGLGDGHGGNVMATRGGPAIRLVDYEVAGWHNPVLDLAKPLYNDAFFAILYSDLMDPCNAMTACGGDERQYVRYRVTEEAIAVDFNLQLSLLDRTLAYIKLEYMVRPLWERLADEFPNDLEFAEDILSAALFSCALLTRNFSSQPDTFFLNAAVGVLLFSDMKGTIDLFFGWANWPINAESSEGGRRRWSDVVKGAHEEA